MKTTLTTLLLCAALACGATEIWVSPKGNDHNSGTQDAPLATLREGLYRAREIRRTKSLDLEIARNTDISNGIRIIMRGGTYTLSETVFVRPEDSGTESSPTIVQAAPGEKPVLSGGVAVRGWKRAGNVAGLPKTAQGKVWVADAPTFGGRAFDFRQMWVNGEKAVRARDVNEGESMRQILKVNKRTEEMWIPTPKLGNLKNPELMEMVLHQMWEVAFLRIKSMTAKGDSTLVKFHQPESRIEFLHPWPPVVIQHDSLGGNSAFFLCNAIEFLDAPGEWFYDARGGKVYYYPRAGENMSAAQVVVPYLENVLRVEGTLDYPVRHVQFRGIGFEHAAWLRPSQMGHVPLQAGMYIIDAHNLRPNIGTTEKPSLCNHAWTGRMPGGVKVRNAHNIIFHRCAFQRMAAAGLDCIDGTMSSLIEGNVFRDLGGSGIQLGSFSEEPFEDHRTFNPADNRVLSRYDRIANNLIENVANEDWGTVGIAAGWVRNATIEHNEIREVSYTGISVGWGWHKGLSAMRDNLVRANYIHRYAKYMYDVAAIYTLSAQPGTALTENYVSDVYTPAYVHDRNHWFYFYTDEGSSYMTVKDNWCPAEKFMQNANGPGVTWVNNGPMVSDEIKKRAGLQKEFRDLLNKK